MHVYKPLTVYYLLGFETLKTNNISLPNLPCLINLVGRETQELKITYEVTYNVM